MTAMRTSRGERGLALVSVLWALSILSLIAASMLSTGTLSYRMERNALNQIRGEYFAEAGITRAILGLLDPRPDRRWRVDGVPQDTTFASTPIRVAIQDVSGLIDLNQADMSLLQRLFESVGVARDEAAAFAARIVDWRTAGDARTLNGANAADYRAAGYSYTPRGSAFQSVDELQLVLGMTPELFARVAPALTVYSHQATVDVHVAPKEALLVLSNMNAREVEATLADRVSNAGALGADDAKRNPAASEPALSLSGRSFAIKSQLTLANRTIVKSAVIRLTNDRAHPYVVLWWE